MNRSRLSQILIILLLLIPTLNFTISSVEFNNKRYKEIIEPYTSTSWDLTETRIIIGNNWSATASAYDWCFGSGKFNDPYIIENITINGLGREFCVIIADSREYFVIRNSNFINTTRNFSNYWNGGGIVFDNASNGQLINNNYSFNDNGISLRGYNNSVTNSYIVNNNIGIIIGAEYSSGTFTTITENIITHNSIGIQAHGSNPNAIGAQIISNNVSYNENNGIYLNYAHNFSISKNFIYNNYGKGIYLNDYCLYNNISKNLITNNTDEGIYLKGSYIPIGYGEIYIDPNTRYNWITENKVTNNSYGIKLNATERNQIINNTINNNQKLGISLHLGYYSTIQNNNIRNNNIGINLANGIHNDIVANTINYNVRYGIYLNYTDFTAISSNNVSNNYIGINLTNSKRNDIVENTINNNQYGIYFTDSRLNAVLNNTLLHNVKCFVEEGNSDGNTFEDNVCPEGGTINVGLIISIVLLSISIISLVVMFWFFKTRSVRK